VRHREVTPLSVVLHTNDPVIVTACGPFISKARVGVSRLCVHVVAVACSQNYSPALQRRKQL
jgi:hypothetical protein